MSNKCVKAQSEWLQFTVKMSSNCATHKANEYNLQWKWVATVQRTKQMSTIYNENE